MAIVNFQLKNCIGQSYNDAKITLTPASIVTGSNFIVVEDSITSTVDNNGSSIFSNVVSNTYLVNVIAGRNNNEFRILVPNTTGSYNAVDLIIT